MMPFTIGLDTLSVKKSGNGHAFSHNYSKIKVDTYASLPVEKL